MQLNSSTFKEDWKLDYSSKYLEHFVKYKKNYNIHRVVSSSIPSFLLENSS
jgi:hypothetical protein